MLKFEKMTSMGHEQIVYFSDSSCDLKAIVAIHNTTLGPALGGTRMWPYASEEEALTDVLRLSKGMTYKAAISGLNLGGGKVCVTAADSITLNAKGFLRLLYADIMQGNPLSGALSTFLPGPVSSLISDIAETCK